jgi:hypothetical protein
MKYLKMLGLAGLAAMALTAFIGAGTASATTLEVGGVTQNSSVSISATLKAGTSAALRDTLGLLANTCTTSEVAGSTESPFSGTTVTGKVSSLKFSNCSDPVTVHQNGSLHVQHITGTTNGTVSSSGAEVTADGPFGYLNCRTGSGTHLGTLTGVGSGNATMDVNAIVDCAPISARWVATYTVTSPAGLGVSA